ncbi:MAG: MaoC family dehydratase N-terminal domain-containing protein [Chloroflexi bacterium]|nr:MaoC family dehydratase N-terminal domain-containing protein [Chloroflexota bacterium]
MAETKVLNEGRITEEGLDKLRALIGKPLRISYINNDLVSRAAIRNFVNGVGDPNPLWTDDEYARKSPYGGIVAPPSWFYSVFPSWVSVGLPGVHGFHSGSEWEFYKPAPLGDSIFPDCTLTHFDDKPSSFADRIIILHYASHFRNQQGELLARAHSWSIRAERGAARKKGKYSEIELPHPYTAEELRKIEDDCLAEETRGDKVRYWEDISVGDDVGPVVKGPFGLTDMLSFFIGSPGIAFVAHNPALKLYRRHPAWGFRDPNTNAMEPIAAVHYNKAAANAAGLPMPYDVGCQRQCWQIHMLTNWMGDAGWLKKDRAEYRRFVYFSDTVYFRGKVTGKYVDEDGEYCVDIETTAVSQRGENTTPGTATVALPSREHRTSPVERRLK